MMYGESMKKVVCPVVVSVFIFQSLDALQLKQYRDFQLDQATKNAFEKGFCEDTDLVRGIIMLRDGVLEQHRHYGNIKFDFKGESNSAVCSHRDKSDDPMTRLLILTHPSAGGSGFNATGTGSISEIFTNRDDLTRIISVMFKIAGEARRNGGNKRKFLKYFGGIENKVYNKDLTGYFERESDTLQRALEKVIQTSDVNELSQARIATIVTKINEARRSVTEENLQYEAYKGKLIDYLRDSLATSQSVLEKLKKKNH